MKRVFKYEFEITDNLVIPMPIGAQILHADIQAGHPCVWALVDPEHAREDRRFAVHGTGHPVFENEVHIATFQQGPFVWHLFERK